MPVLGSAVAQAVSNGTSVGTASGPALTAVTQTPTSTWESLPEVMVPYDQQFAWDTLAVDDATNWLRTTGYGFAIPETATINGIRVVVRGIAIPHLDDGVNIQGAHDGGARLIVANLIQGNDQAETDAAIFWPVVSPAQITQYAEGLSPVDDPPAENWNQGVFDRVYGSDSDLWGLALTPSDVNNAQFGFALSVANLATSPHEQILSIDGFTIFVSYTLPGETSSEVQQRAAIGQLGYSVVQRAAISIVGEGDVTQNAAVGFGLTVTTPTGACPTITTAAMVIDWSMTASAQVGFRIQIFEDASAITELYDSGFIGGSNTNFVVPAGVLGSPETELYLRVTVTNDGGITTASELQCFNTSFPTSVNVAGVQTIVVGGCDEPRVLPGIRIEWNQVTEGPGETFVTYAVRRRKEGTTKWTTIAEVGDITELSVVDYNVEPVVRYEYSVVWRATSGTNTLQAADTSPAPIGTVDFEFNYLHAANLLSTDDDFTWVRMDSFEAQKDVEQDVQYVQPWGRDLPTSYIGQKLGTRLSVPLREDLLSKTRRWDRLRTLTRIQRDRSAVLMMRFGRSKESYFVTIAGLGKSDFQKTTTSRVDMVETYYEEGV
jgi:hypothetical protein